MLVQYINMLFAASRGTDISRLAVSDLRQREAGSLFSLPRSNQAGITFVGASSSIWMRSERVLMM